MNLNLKSKQLSIITFALLLMFNRTYVKIVILPNLSTSNKKYWVGEKYNILINNYPKIKYEKIYFKSKYNRIYLDLLDGKIIMKSSGRECLTAYNKALKGYTCFNIYNTPNINFKENNPLKLQIKTVRKLVLSIYDYPKSNIRYMSNNPGIIKVNNEGEIKAINPGSALISASGLDNKTATIKIISLADNGLINNYTLEHLKINQYDKLMIVAHPDDEILWGGANLYRHKYFIVCVTNGDNAIRANEFKKILNFTKCGGIMLNYTDLEDNRISKWLEIQNGIIKDLTLIISYKHWEKIVTHGPEGTTGHYQHIKISNFVSEITKANNKFNILYYFEKFYKKQMIPKNLRIINKKDLEVKLKEVEIYQSQKDAIYKYWSHFLAYENFILASKLKNISG